MQILIQKNNPIEERGWSNVEKGPLDNSVRTKQSIGAI